MVSRFLFPLVVISLASVGDTSAQSMFAPGLQWSVGSGSHFSGDESTLRYRIGGDTAIGRTTYRFVLVSETASGDDFVFPTPGILLREDGNGGVHGRNTGAGHAGVLYDFAAEVGDTLRTFNPNYPNSQCEQVVVATGDTTLSDGVLRRTYQTGHPDHDGRTSLVIEGFGNVDEGPFGMACGTGAGDYLRCLLAEGESPLVNPTSGACFVSGAPTISAAAPGQAYPNPFDSYLEFDFVNDRGERYELFDARGALVRGGALADGRLRLATSDLPAGLYLVSVRLRGGGRRVARVVKP